MVETLRLRAGVSGERVSETMKLQFVDRAGRYILQQLHRVKYRHGATREEWRDVKLNKES